MNRKCLLRSLKDKSSRAVVFYNELRLNRMLLLNTRSEVHAVFAKIYHSSRLFPDLKDIKYVLECTIRDHQKEIFTFLLNQGLSMHMLELSHGKSTAHVLAENEFFDGLRLIVRFNSENYSDSHGFSYFHAACMIGKTLLVKRYIDEGLDVNKNTYPISPLHIAAWYRQSEVVGILLDCGVDPNLRDESSLTPLHRLCLRTTYPLKFDQNLEYDETRASKIVQLLIEHGADIESKNGRGFTPLQMAVSRFSYELTKALLVHGANIHNLDDDNIFMMDFRAFEVKHSALTMDIIAVVQLLESEGYIMNDVRVFAMLSLWIQCYKDVNYPALFDLSGESASALDDFIIDYLATFERGELFVKEQMKNYLLREVFNLRGVVNNQECTSCKIVKYLDEVEALKKKILHKKVTWHTICSLSPERAFHILKQVDYWPIIKSEEFSTLFFTKTIIKKHLAASLIRKYTEPYAVKILESFHEGLNLPFPCCKNIVKYLSNNDLLTICTSDYPRRIDSNK